MMGFLVFRRFQPTSILPHEKYRKDFEESFCK